MVANVVRRFGGFTALLFLLIALLYSGAGRDRQPGAVVNGENLPIKPIERQVELVKRNDPARFRGAEGAAEERELKRMLLSARVQVKLIAQGARKEGVTVSGIEVSNEIARRRAQHKSTGEFGAALAAQGIDNVVLADLVRDQLLGIKIREHLTRAVRVTDSEINSYLQDHRRELERPGRLVKFGVITVDTDYAAKQVGDALSRGQTFETAAGRYSVTPDKTEQDWRPETLVDPAIMAGLARLTIGEHTELFPEPDNSLSIYKLLGRKNGEATPVQLREAVADRLLRDKQNSTFDAWVRGIQESAKITYL